jgi:hypothetical protein
MDTQRCQNHGPVRLLVPLLEFNRSSTEAGEQTWATGRGVGGAKGEDRGEHGRATSVPDTAPGKRVPEAQLCTNKLPSRPARVNT